MTKIVVQDSIASTPEWVTELQQRHQLIVQRVFRGMVVDEDSDDDESAEDVVLTIHDNSKSFARTVEIDINVRDEKFRALDEEMGITTRQSRNAKEQTQAGVQVVAGSTRQARVLV